MNAGYAGDFERFMRAGRIGSPAEMSIELEALVLAPVFAAVRGRVRCSHAQLRTLAWRMRGDLVWTAAPLRGELFEFPTPGRTGTLELRSLALPHDGSPELVAWAFAELAWPAAQIQIGERPARVERQAAVHVGIRVQWVEHLVITFEDGSTDRQEFEAGRMGTCDLVLPTRNIGLRRVRLDWRANDGSEGVEILTYTVTARPLQLTIRRLHGGGLHYCAQHAEALALQLPGAPSSIPVPHAGVIQSALLVPLCAVLTYSDEAGERRETVLRLDHAPRKWPTQRGFASLGNRNPQTPSHFSRSES